MSFRVVGLSNATVDMSFQIDSFPILPSQHQFVGQRLITAGGMANTFFCGARLGLQMEALGHIGGDDLGQIWRSQAMSEGIIVDRQIVIADQPTTICVTLTDPSGEHIFIGHRGDLKLGQGEFPDVWREAIQTADALMIYGWTYLSMGPEANLVAIEIAKEANIPIFFDPGPEIPHMPPEWLQTMYRESTVVTLTADEGRLSLGTEATKALSPEEIAAAIHALGPKLVILKLGANGMLGHTASETIFQPGISVEVADLTGAGDSVAAAVILSFLRGDSLTQTLALANATGAACVQKFGAGLNVPTREEIEAVLNRVGSGTTV